MIAVYLSILSIALQVTSCSNAVYYDLPDDNDTVVTLLGHHVLLTPLNSSYYNKGLSINPPDQSEKSKVWVPAKEVNAVTSGCFGLPRPTTVKVARLMLEMFRNLEGKDNILMDDLVEKLIKSKVLVEASLLEPMPDFNILAKKYASFPKIMSVLWLAVTDPINTKNHGWCSVDHMSKYLSVRNPAMISRDVNSVKQLITGARGIIEMFIMEVGDSLSAVSSEEHGRRHAQEQSATLIKNTNIPGFDDTIRSYQKPNFKMVTVVSNDQNIYDGQFNRTNAARSNDNLNILILVFQISQCIFFTLL